MGRERIFDVSVGGSTMPGIVRSMKMARASTMSAPYAGPRTVSAGPSRFGAIVGPYRIESVAKYRALSVMTNKAAQEAVRGFGQSPDPTMRIEKGAIDKGRRPRSGSTASRWAAAQTSSARKQFPYLIPSGTHYDSGDYHTVVDKVVGAGRIGRGLLQERDPPARKRKWLAGIGHRGVPGAGAVAIRRFEPLLQSERTPPRPGWTPAASWSTGSAHVDGDDPHDPRSGQGHETLAATVVGEVMEIDPDRIRIVAAGFACEPAEQLAGSESRMAVDDLGGAAFHGGPASSGASSRRSPRHQFRRRSRGRRFTRSAPRSIRATGQATSNGPDPRADRASSGPT